MKNMDKFSQCFNSFTNEDKLKSLYDQFSLKPIPTNAIVLDDVDSLEAGLKPNRVKILYNIRDTYQLKTCTVNKTFHLKDDRYVTLDFPTESAEQSLEAYSPDGKIYAVLKTKCEAKGAKSEQFIVVYGRDGLKSVIDVKTINDEISIVDKANFSSFVLNEDGTVLLCVAQLNENSKNKEESPNRKTYNLDRHEYKQSWGEKFSTILHTSILAIDLVNRNHVLIDKVGISLNQPFFFQTTNKVNKIGCIGYQEEPYKLGMIYCSNRVSYLFTYSYGDFTSLVNFEPEMVYGDGGKFSLNSPRVFYDHKGHGYDNKVLFLQYAAGGPHRNAASLQLFNFETNKSTTVMSNSLPRRLEQKPDGSMTYSNQGPLFTFDLPSNCFSADGKFVITSTMTPLQTQAVAIPLDQTNTANLLAFPEESCTIIGLKQNWILAIGSAINSLPTVYLGYFDESKLADITWIQVEEKAPKLNITYGTFMVASRGYRDKYVTAIWTSPSELVGENSPTVITVHGGPHSQVTLGYYQSVALYNQLGFKTCLMNYVGSTGVDSEYTEALLGKIGTADVDDVHDAIQYMIDNHHAHKDCIILNGGSHGGFLVTNISGRYPKLNFMACIARNPVIDVCSMTAVTDIPDWNLTEALGVTSLIDPSDLYPVDGEQLLKMYLVSPLSVIQKVKVPTLMLLGREDLRVPHSQGLLYHRLLKAMGVETRCFIYDDVHDLYKINVDFDCFLNVAKFIGKFLKYFIENGNSPK